MAIAIELTDFSVFYSQDSIDHVAESLKKDIFGNDIFGNDTMKIVGVTV